MTGDVEPSCPTASDAALPEGTTLLDRYVIEDEVASGGMATIHRARDTRLERIVCVKLLRVLLRSESASNADTVYRLGYRQFLQEALSLSKLQHPNTLRIYDFGYLDDARPFQISEYLDGGNLEEYQRARGPLDGDEALAIIEPITGALAEAHELGIIHRDIKPSNILFSLAGGVKFPKLADFGIARSELCEPLFSPVDASQENSVAAASTVTLFSPRWAAPEQLINRGEGPFTDVYALALTVASLLFGRPFFNDANIRQTFGRRASGDTLVRARLDALSTRPRLHDVLARALTADVSQRTPTPTIFCEELRRALAPASPKPPGPLAPSAARRSMESITVELSDVLPRSVEATRPETWHDLGERVVRIVPIVESVDIIARGPERDVRFRVTLIPGTTRERRAHVKALNCFVRRPGGSASAATNAEVDGEAEFLSDSRTPFASCRWAFGTKTDLGLVFCLADEDIVLPDTDPTPILAIEIRGQREIIVLAPVPQNAALPRT
jgi:serine/threonine protein kinase